MAYIPAAMNGNKIQHDIKFSNDSSISGVVSGVQNIELGADSTLLLGGTAGSNEFVMGCDFLAVDPTGDRVLKLPAALGDLNLVGRTIKIFNSADANGELITLTDFRGLTSATGVGFICYIGKGQLVEIFITSHDATTGALEFVIKTELFQHTVQGANNANVDILPFVAGKAFIPLRAVISSAATPNVNGGKIQVEDGGTDIDFITMPNTALAADTPEVMVAAGFTGFSPVGVESGTLGKVFRLASTSGSDVTVVTLFYVQI
jgi:hypothetical protein